MQESYDAWFIRCMMHTIHDAYNEFFLSNQMMPWYPHVTNEIVCDFIGFRILLELSQTTQTSQPKTPSKFGKLNTSIESYASEVTITESKLD